MSNEGFGAPFGNEQGVMEIDELTIENGTEELVIYGTLGIKRDQQGLASAKHLLAVMQQAVEVLEKEHQAGNLPEVLELPSAPMTEVDNPFGQG